MAFGDKASKRCTSVSKGHEYDTQVIEQRHEKHVAIEERVMSPVCVLAQWQAWM